MKALRQTVDLSAYPDLVVIYLGMTVNMLTGIKTLFGFGPKIEGSVAGRPQWFCRTEPAPSLRLTPPLWSRPIDQALPLLPGEA